MALVWSKMRASSYGCVCDRVPPRERKRCPRISESQQPKPVVPPPIILVSYKHEISANTFERGVRNETGAGLLPTLSIDGVAVSVTKSEGERG